MMSSQVSDIKFSAPFSKVPIMYFISFATFILSRTWITLTSRRSCSFHPCKWLACSITLSCHICSGTRPFHSFAQLRHVSNELSRACPSSFHANSRFHGKRTIRMFTSSSNRASTSRPCWATSSIYVYRASSLTLCFRESSFVSREARWYSTSYSR